MVSALTFNPNKDFRLGSKIDELLGDLDRYNFSGLKREVILQCITNSFGKVYFDQSKNLENLVRRKDFIDVTLNVIEKIKIAVKFLYENLYVVYSKLLPYNNQLVFITDFFVQVQNPSKDQLETLKKWFWVTTYSSYFTIYSLSKQRAAYNSFQKFIKEDSDPIFYDRSNSRFTVVDFPNKIYFGSVRANALVLFLLNNNSSYSKINPDEIEGIKQFYLFKEHKVPEGIIPILKFYGVSENDFQFYTGSIKPKDLSKFLERSHDEVKGYFISQHMIDIFNDTSLGREEKMHYILTERKQLIQSAERDFVTNLGLIYDENPEDISF